VEGGGSKTFSRAKSLLYDQPEVLRHLLNVLADSVAAYLNAQIAAGAQALMIFDTWGGALSPEAYREFSLAPMQRIVDQLDRPLERRHMPVILFTKGGGAWLEAMADTGCDALGLDWTVEINAARQRVGDRVALQGNLDPCVLYAEPEHIRTQAANILAQYGQGSGHIFNLGHGIHPDIKPGHVNVLIDAVHELSRAYHTGC
jgi:uroporphyrinogen decarboxylase